MAYTYNPQTGQLEWTEDSEDGPTSGARRGMLESQALDNLSDYDNFVYTQAGGLGLSPDRIAPNPDGTGNYMLTFRPGDPWYDQLIQRGMVQPGPDGSITVPSNMLSGALPGYGMGEADEMSVYGPIIASLAFGGAAMGAAGAGAEGATGAVEGGELAGMGGMGGGGGGMEVAGAFDMGGTYGGATGAGGLIEGSGGAYPALGGAAGSGAGAGALTAEQLAQGASTVGTAGSQMGGSGGGGGGGEAPIVSGAGGMGDILSAGLGSVPGNVWQGLLQGGLGYLGAGQQSDAMQNMYNQSLALGAPSRARNEASYQPGFNLWDQPGYAGAFDQAADSAARAVSARSGNPWGNPGAMGEIQGALMNNAYLPALANYRGQNMQGGGFGLNTAGQAGLMGAQNAGAGLDAIGYGVGTAMQQQPDWSKLFGGTNLNIGGMPWGRR